jgi:hypothetical protein
MSRWNALIRTHHITSRRKVSKLKQAAGNSGVYVLLRSGGAPGLMYVEGPEQDGVENWVSAVQVGTLPLAAKMREAAAHGITAYARVEIALQRLPAGGTTECHDSRDNNASSASV